jgi:hemoglobin-like flavoprotein
VNTASRIERMTKELDAPILLSDSVVDHLEGELRIGSSRSIRLKGQSDTTVLCRCDDFASPDPILLVQSSFHQIATRLIAFGNRFYAILFEFNPVLRPLFNDDLAVQSRMLVSMLSSLVKGLNRTSKIEGGLRALGKRHSGYRASAGDYDKIANALLLTLNEFLDDDFAPEVRNAWMEVFARISDMMVQGTRDEPASQ